ncbi:MAG TPA: tRNA (N(6)-L-threonylcarbamoyladenosine(37)-C(2))-methylthiotransferase MtaB, partial [Bacteroidota bacterium]|nr:tRNA (N(6)-L-threonylcarbamoyladenosine(37)-C(2))-methylthiotransferase MtaB [Bacteroidota bacterium]
SVTARADRECRQLVRQAVRRSPDSFVIVLGCYAQLQPEEIASIDGVDLVLGAREKFRVFDHARGFAKADVPRIEVSPITEAIEFGPASSAGGGERTRAFLKVQDGCDFNCSFCTIPLARGKSRSLSFDECVREAQHLVTQGYREIVLTGVNVGDYGRKGGSSLVELLRGIESVEGLERIRISSIEPNLLDEELLEHWLASEKICDHFHIPLQSGNDEVLRLMRRRYDLADYRNLVETIRRASPAAAIGVDVIAGFPGETESNFISSLRFIEELPVSYLHVFTYSERPNTPSLGFGDRVEPRVRFSRSEFLRTVGEQKRQAFHLSQIHTSRPALIEETVDGNMLSGYTDNYIRVFLPYHASLVNTIVRVRLDERVEEGCLASPDRGFAGNTASVAA